ncbi:MAG: hypothetical protein ABI969_09150 [bacterium]
MSIRRMLVIAPALTLALRFAGAQQVSPAVAQTVDIESVKPGTPIQLRLVGVGAPVTLMSGEQAIIADSFTVTTTTRVRVALPAHGSSVVISLVTPDTAAMFRVNPNGLAGQKYSLADYGFGLPMTLERSAKAGDPILTARRMEVRGTP